MREGYICKCGWTFPEESGVGKYGCMNCNGSHGAADLVTLLVPGDPCPEADCLGRLALDDGQAETWDEPGIGPSLYCEECGIETDHVDWNEIQEQADGPERRNDEQV